MNRSIDFTTVKPEHASIHERLINWARWCKPQHSASILPMFQGYRPYLYPERECVIPIDSKDALAIQRCMAHLPIRERHAIGWCYVIRSNPLRACRILSVSGEGLMEMIHKGRAMVQNTCAEKIAPHA